MKTTKKTIGILIACIVLGGALTTYAVSTLFNKPQKTYDVTIYLHANENTTQQLQTILKIIKELYQNNYQSPNIIMPTLSSPGSLSENKTPPTYVETFVLESLLPELLHTLESNGFTVTYQEQKY